MTLFASIVIVVAAAAFVAMPFFNAAPVAEAGAVVLRVPGERQMFERQKADAYAAIKEAEFDYQMGKLSDADFKLVRDKYTAQALEAIAALDMASVARARQTKEARRPTRIAFCPICGRGIPPRANFCPACGQSLSEAVA
jgi:NACalpha-BTF3-like transcription factor